MDMDTARKHELAYLALLAFVAGQKGGRQEPQEPNELARFVEAWTNPERSFVPKPNAATDTEWQGFAALLYVDATPEHVPSVPAAYGGPEAE